MDVLPPTKKIRLWNINDQHHHNTSNYHNIMDWTKNKNRNGNMIIFNDIPESNRKDKLSIINQPVEHLELIVSYLHFDDLQSLQLVNGIFYDVITRSKQCIQQILKKYCQIPFVKTESMYNVVLFNKNIASILYQSYFNYITDNLVTIKRQSRSLPMGQGIDTNFELIDKHDITPINIYDESQKTYFRQLRFIFDKLGIWNKMVSIIFNPKDFNHLCLFHNTNIFKAYSRLLSYNFISQFPTDVRLNDS